MHYLPFCGIRKKVEKNVKVSNARKGKKNAKLLD